MFRKIISCAAAQTTQLHKFSTLTTKVVETEALEKTLNQVTLLGRVGQNPQKRGTEERPLVIFSLATHSNYKYENGDFMQRTEWHRICVFKPYLRDTIYKHLKKGQRILVSGKINYSEVKDDEGNVRPTTNIIADDVIFFTS